MNRYNRTIAALACGIGLFLSPLRAQESTVYVTTVKTGIFIVGSQTPAAGVFYQHPSADTVWQHSGPSHTRGFSVDIPPTTKGAIKYVASGNGVHKVDETAGTWRTVTDWRVTEVLDVTSQPSDPNTVYLACAYGVWRSNDGGTTWNESAQTTLKPGHTSKVIVDYSNEKRVLCASFEGAFESTDGAVTWKRMTGLTVKGILTIRQHPTNPKILFAGTEDNGMYKSTDGGASWTKCESGIDHSTFYSIAFDPQHPDTMYASGYVTGVYKSMNGGASWRRTNTGLTDLNVHSIAVDPRDSRRVYAGTINEGIFRSEDGGQTWRQNGLQGSMVWDVKIINQ